MDDITEKVRRVIESGTDALVRCVAHDDTKPSLSLSRGDNGKLLWKCFAGCSQEAVGDALRALGVSLGPDDNAPPSPAGNDWRPAVWREINRAWEDGALLDEAKPLMAYMGSRGLYPDWPERLLLRFNPRVFYRRETYLPAMLAPMVKAGKLVGLHATYLQPDGSGKASVIPARKVWKPSADTVTNGAAIPLYPLRLPNVAYTFMGVAEGIETALALRKLTPGLPVWATVSAGGMRALKLPDGVNHLLIGADNDEPGLAAARDLAKRASRNGIRAVIKWPDAGDWADVA